MATRVTVAVNGHRSNAISGSSPKGEVVAKVEQSLYAMANGNPGSARLIFQEEGGDEREEALSSTDHKTVAGAIRRHLR